MNLLRKIKRIVTDADAKEYFAKFQEVVRTRGAVAYFQDAREVKTNGAGITEAIAVQCTTTKLVLLPGDPYDFVTPTNLVAFEPLNRRTRRSLEKIRSKTCR